MTQHGPKNAKNRNVSPFLPQIRYTFCCTNVIRGWMCVKARQRRCTKNIGNKFTFKRSHLLWSTFPNLSFQKSLALTRLLKPFTPLYFEGQFKVGAFCHLEPWCLSRKVYKKLDRPEGKHPKRLLSESSLCIFCVPARFLLDAVIVHWVCCYCLCVHCATLCNKYMIDVPSSWNMATSSTKKPFSYCPGGINFSELKTKSPSMARRLEKHQEHMNTPSQATQQLLPSALSPVNQQMVNHLFEFCLFVCFSLQF